LDRGTRGDPSGENVNVVWRCTVAELSRLPGPIADIWEWQLDGACREADPTLFFHPEGERGPARRLRDGAAKAVCAACPVLTQCRQHALAVREPYGVWGGLSEDDRLVILGGERETAFVEAV
jgi:WhiB family transcriptional regulator, redox-sensing transcriptional regulator